MVRQDPAVRQEVNAYLDDLQWLSRVKVPAPQRQHTEAGRQQLMAQLHRSRRRQFVPARVLGVAVGVSLLCAVVATNQQATSRLPGPIDQAMSGFFRRDDQIQASPFSADLSTPAEATLDPAGAAFTR